MTDQVIQGRPVPGPRSPAPGPRPAGPSSASPASAGPARTRSLRYEHIALVDLLDRLLAGGVVISGEVRLAIADVDLVNVSLHALISSVGTILEHAGPAAGAGQDREAGT